VPGGVDEYLRLVSERSESGSAGSGPTTRPAEGDPSGAPPAGDTRTARKELNAVERRLAKVTAQAAAVRDEMDRHDPTDHVGLTTLHDRLDALAAKAQELEHRWLELAEQFD